MNNIMVYPVKSSFCFSSYTNPRTSVESNENLPTKQKLQGETMFSKNHKSYEIYSTNIYVGEDLEFIIHVFSWCILIKSN